MEDNRTPWENLCSAIAEQAVTDYRAVKNGKKINQVSKEELERFFKSGWFYELTHMDGRMVLKALNA